MVTVHHIFLYQDVESALKGVKKAVRRKVNSYYGRKEESSGRVRFNVYNGGKVIEEHLVSR